MNKLSPNRQNPEICFGIGDYKKKNYYLARGFEELKATLKEHNKSLSDQRSLRLHSTHAIFQDREWTPRVVCALVLRKYIYQAFLCGTDRVFISDHQSFSGFFRYNIANDGIMVINYYVINDPETVEHGITLRSAIAGFFYEERKEALDSKERLAKALEVGTKTKGKDPFYNVVPRPVEEPSQDRKRSKLSGSELRRELKPIEENIDYDDFDEIHGNTCCRRVYDASKCYPSLRSILPTDVFVKLYNYPDLAFENFPEKDSYYDMFVNELEINKILAKSQFASHFPKLIISGYLNGVPSQPMHIFEDLGEELSMSKWDYKKVYGVIKSRLEEIHLLGICHNDVRAANIHVSVSGKISLIDFGLSVFPCKEKCKRRDFEALDDIFRAYVDTRQEDMREGSTNHSRSSENDETSSSDEVIFDKEKKESQKESQNNYRHSDLRTGCRPILS
ncbi:uncharacterized protein PRCAT00005280001 [Priceomyces carsonii]|uniref:uncharacterized protein n=1 Tax=Priceomyces carsonii TaxID=28549 RepID=UPI002EDB855C|nr:unnamed protein product [Priceomyces carsonii]